MKFVAITSLFFVAASASAMQRREDTSELNFEQLFISSCASDLYEKCPKEAEALMPYIGGEKADLKAADLLKIASQVALINAQENKVCRDGLRNCAGEIVKQAIIQLLAENPEDA